MRIDTAAAAISRIMQREQVFGVVILGDPELGGRMSVSIPRNASIKMSGDSPVLRAGSTEQERENTSQALELVSYQLDQAGEVMAEMVTQSRMARKRQHLTLVDVEPDTVEEMH